MSSVNLSFRKLTLPTQLTLPRIPSLFVTSNYGHSEHIHVQIRKKSCNTQGPHFQLRQDKTNKHTNKIILLSCLTSQPMNKCFLWSAQHSAFYNFVLFVGDSTVFTASKWNIQVIPSTPQCKKAMLHLMAKYVQISFVQALLTALLAEFNVNESTYNNAPIHRNT